MDIDETLIPHIMNKKEQERYIAQCNFPYCNESSKYEKVIKIGQGTFG